MWLLLSLVIFAFLLGAPYALYFDSQKLDKPVVVFTARFWRVAPWLIATVAFAGFLLVIATLLTVRPNGGFTALLGAAALAPIGLGLGFIVLRLHLSYWRHDQDATLTVHRQEARADYYNKGFLLSFALADVVQITEYATLTRSTRGPIWSNYSYRIFVLQDGTELLMTCLMYAFLGPQDLMPTADHHTVSRYICWLPGDELSFPTLF